MDGNGRWAVERGAPRSAGHQAGAAAVRRVVESAPELDIGTLTLYAFSTDNWRRPEQEVSLLMELLYHYLISEARTCVAEGVRLSLIGRRDRLPRWLQKAVEVVETATRDGSTLHLRLAVDYSAREAILTAASRLPAGQRASREEFARLVTASEPRQVAVPDVDLLIRTGGEQRLSDFLLWESAYAELYFTPVRWPDFGREHLEAALAEFRRRERRFGGLTVADLGGAL
jgi:undecaprenyl diphosphate synthase